MQELSVKVETSKMAHRYDLGQDRTAWTERSKIGWKDDRPLDLRGFQDGGFGMEK
jgi:hypothetical protein